MEDEATVGAADVQMEEGRENIEEEKNDVSLLTTRDKDRDMNESLIIDLITNKPTIEDDDKDNDNDNEDNADDMAQVVEQNINTALKQQTNVNQQADLHMTFNVNDKIEEKEELEINEITLERTTTTITILNAIKEQKETHLNAQEKQNKNSNLSDKQQNREEGEAEDDEKLSKKLLKTSMSLSKDIEEKAEQKEFQQQIEIQIYNNTNNNNNENNDDNNVTSNQYTNLKTLSEKAQNVSKFVAVTDIDENFMSVSTEAVNGNFLGTTDNDDDDDDKVVEKKHQFNKDVSHNVDNYWTRSNRVDNANDKQTTEATTRTVNINNCENNTMDDDYLIESTTTTNEKIEMMKVDKFILNDRQIDSTTIEKVEHNLMEINEQNLIGNSNEKEQHMQSNNVDDNDDEGDTDADDDGGNELNKLIPQHLLLDELMLNDVGVEEATDTDTNTNKSKEEHANPYVVTNNNIDNYIVSGNEDIDIVSLEDRRAMPTDELFYKTLPAPQVMESFDKPNKRILVNVTIATDDADGSVYTLHVALPTGRGQNDERNIEQVLTHERRRIDPPASPYCYPEPPPVIPECPCACDDFTTTTDIEEITDEILDIIDDTTTTDTTLSTTTTFATSMNLTKHDTDNETNSETNFDTTTSYNMGVGKAITPTTISTACPDVMPILILEGARTFPARSFPPDGTTFGQISIGQKLSKEIQPYSYWSMQILM